MKLSYFFLLIGFLLSLFLVCFKLNGGFEIVGYKLQTSLVEYAGVTSNEKYLTTTIFSYILLLLFGWSLWKNFKSKDFVFLLFLALCLLSFINELYYFYEDYLGLHDGGHFRVGILLAILGLITLFRLRRIKKKQLINIKV